MSEVLRLLSDPMRSRIYLEALLREEITTKHLIGLLSIGRSTLGYHLEKMVKTGILEVRTAATGRPTKYYRVSEKAKQEQILKEVKKSDDPSVRMKQYIQFLDVLTRHLQAIVSLTREMSEALRVIQQERLQSVPILQMTGHFIFNILSEEEAVIWNTKVTKFLVEIEKELSQKRGPSTTTEQQTHIAFSGVIPIIRRTKE